MWKGGVVCCDLEPGISRKPAINSSACIRRFVLLPTRLIFQIRFINLFFFDPILAHRLYSCIVSASAVQQGFFKGRPTNISSFKNYTSSVEATATTLKLRCCYTFLFVTIRHPSPATNRSLVVQPIWRSKLDGQPMTY